MVAQGLHTGAADIQSQRQRNGRAHQCCAGFGQVSAPLRRARPRARWQPFAKCQIGRTRGLQNGAQTRAPRISVAPICAHRDEDGAGVRILLVGLVAHGQCVPGLYWRTSRGDRGVSCIGCSRRPWRRTGSGGSGFAITVPITFLTTAYVLAPLPTAAAVRQDHHQAGLRRRGYNVVGRLKVARRGATREVFELGDPNIRRHRVTQPTR
ncbi:hypothetical protein B0H17DRAFT_1102664 [Mycena rosella]|uniref:Uncharacterized protein n=1 Tax=Mycena rosella TaxID=1033263 RepID=A0AAD7CHB7_MYCRO|nr:hypothetical protein B0H17DRAFT_1102664 [Mycena rosella]